MTQDKENPLLDADLGASARDELRAKLVTETARLPWTELQRFYARGQVVQVAPELDLIDVATVVAQDERAQVQAWMEQGRFGTVTTDQAQVWFDNDSSLWTVVVAPWVLVQEGNDPRTANQPERVRH